MSRRIWTEEKIISEIQKLYKQKEDLWYRAMERNHKDLIRASERYFKGWKNAVLAAGLDYDSIKKRSHQVWTKNKILKKLNELQSQFPKLRPRDVQNLDKKLYHATIRQFQNFGNALSELQDKYESKPKLQSKSELESDIRLKSKSKPKAGKPDLSSKSKKKVKAETVEELDQNMKIFTVRTRIRSERNVGEAIEKRAKNQNVNIGSIQYPAILNGYLFVECDNREDLNRLIKNIRNAQGLLNGETTMKEISEYLETPKSKKHLIEGTKVEITDGQFRGERAVIQHVNDRTKELTVELIDEVLKIPITISKNQCKILSKMNL